MQFVKYLRDAVRHGAVTCSVRIWKHPHVKAGNRYRMEDGWIEVDEVMPITMEDITPELALASGFKSVPDLLSVARHGEGESVYLIRFHYIPPSHADAPATVSSPRRPPSTRRRTKR
jgi:hypothetical protein